MSNSFKITNVNIFNGKGFQNGDVTVVDGKISKPSDTSTTTIDGSDKFLIPGLIDCHVHLRGEGILQKLAQHGVTTALDMGCIPYSLIDSLRNQPGLPDIRSAGPPATCPGSQHSRIVGLEDYLISDPSQAQDWVDKRIEQGSDYIKVVSDNPGPSVELMKALTDAAHNRKKVVIAHAMRKSSFEMAVDAGVDFLTHLPLDEPLADATVQKMKAQGTIAIPTMTINEAIPVKHAEMGWDFRNGFSSFKTLYQAGVPMIAGSDSNAERTCPLEHGHCLHHELKLMVDGGYDTAEALRSATEFPSQLHLGDVFGLGDRGKIQEGLRADLVLLGKNPLDDIENTRSIERIWIQGVEYQK